ncbi:thioredoxin [Deinococcus cellulosilyticus NBRC 106333 = KACC 11606]|uniref:Thioredoxin n=2 Tax=Deinococcus cellulosilyticus TaxID=401558 RepID=A0A511N8Y2_DEIC1|nr:thioredoxin [Deinococcus cellulosilyticus NBRC 106333 = KACC 11606]
MGGTAGVYSVALDEQREAARDAFLSRSPMWGNKESNIVIVEFGDFNCKACQALHQKVYREAIEQHVRSGRAVYYYVDVGILGKDSEAGSRFLYCLQKHDSALASTFVDSLYARPEQHWNASKYRRLYQNLKGEQLSTLQGCTRSRAAQAFVKENQYRMRKSMVRELPGLVVGDRQPNFNPQDVEALLQEMSGWTVSIPIADPLYTGQTH